MTINTCIITSSCANGDRGILTHYNRTPHPSMGATDIQVPAGRCRYPAEAFAALQSPRIPVAASTCCRVCDNVGVVPNNCVTARHSQFGRSVTIGRHRNFVRHGSAHRGLHRGDRCDGRCKDEGMQMHGPINYDAPRQYGCPDASSQAWSLGVTYSGGPPRPPPRAPPGPPKTAVGFFIRSGSLAHCSFVRMICASRTALAPRFCASASTGRR